MSRPTRSRGRFDAAASALAVLAVSVLLSVAAPRPAHACSCVWIPTLEVERAQSAAIFTGFPIGVRSAAPEHPEAIWVRFQVGAVWKGAVTPTIEILTGANGGLCGIEFQSGVEYLVFAHGGGQAFPGLLSAYLCGRTAPALNNPDVRDLGPPIATPLSPASWGKLKVLYRG